MPHTANAVSVLETWYSSLDEFQDHLPSKGSICAALIVLGRLQSDFNLDIGAHVSGGEAQITGLSASAVKRELSRYGESRILSSVGGRSNRGARGDVSRQLQGMHSLGLDSHSDEVRNAVLMEMQRHIVCEFVPRYFQAKRVKATFDQSTATSRFIGGILENARSNGKGGAVAEYLVGAKLALYYPNKEIRNKRFSAADAPTGHEGDFEVGTTAFHVTLAPMGELFEKIKRNLERGWRVYLLVGQANQEGARQLAETYAPGKIEVDSIESFIATNIDELAEFDAGILKSGLLRYLERYNTRVDAIELDKSLLIEIPPNLT